ncbi:MAG TPA: heme-binding protein, partial [Isosphaeraceae bacterium]
NDAGFRPGQPDRSLEAEFIAFAAAGGSRAGRAPVGRVGGVAPLPGLDLPFGRIDLNGVTLDIFGPGGIQGISRLARLGRRLGAGNPDGGVNLPVDPGPDAVPGTPDDRPFTGGAIVPEGWLVMPHDGVGLVAADVVDIISRGIATANRTRAAIRLPVDSRTRMTFAVTDATGAVLGLYRMPDATTFSIDVSVAKARNVAYYADPARLQEVDRIPGLPPGVAFSSRTIRYAALPYFPEGQDNYPPGPFSILNDGGHAPGSPLDAGPPPPASAFASVQGYDAFHPQTNFRDPANILNQNGVVFFPGGVPLYKDTNNDGVRDLVGGLGVSGDGVDQDDVVTFFAAQGYEPPAGTLRADQVFVRGVRLPYQKFNRNPFG